eukprot:814130-Pleurochrysis_carterae.AAC.1
MLHNTCCASLRFELTGVRDRRILVVASHAASSTRCTSPPDVPRAAWSGAHSAGLNARGDARLLQAGGAPRPLKASHCEETKACRPQRIFAPRKRPLKVVKKRPLTIVKKRLMTFVKRRPLRLSRSVR